MYMCITREGKQVSTRPRLHGTSSPKGKSAGSQIDSLKLLEESALVSIPSQQPAWPGTEPYPSFRGFCKALYTPNEVAIDGG